MCVFRLLINRIGRVVERKRRTGVRPDEFIITNSLPVTAWKRTNERNLWLRFKLDVVPEKR